MRFQKRFFQDCSGTTTASSGACIDLATQDTGLFSIYKEYEATNTDLFTREVEVTEAIKTVADTMKLLKCPQMPTASYSVEKDVGYIDTETLYMKLSELSPYYVSPDIITELANVLFQIGQNAESENVKDSAKVIKGRTENITNILRPYRV